MKDKIHGKITIIVGESVDGTQPFIDVEPMEFLAKLPEAKQASFFNMIASWAFQNFKTFNVQPPKEKPKSKLILDDTKH